MSHVCATENDASALVTRIGVSAVAPPSLRSHRNTSEPAPRTGADARTVKLVPHVPAAGLTRSDTVPVTVRGTAAGGCAPRAALMPRPAAAPAATATSAIASRPPRRLPLAQGGPSDAGDARSVHPRSEEHTSELQSQFHLVCRLLLEKKKQI